MMLCERCGQRPATVHMTEINNGQKKDAHICEVCAGEMQPQGFGFVLPQMHLHQFLAGLLNHEVGTNKQKKTEISGGECDKCGVGDKQITNQGLLGCGDCYPYFEDKVLPILRRIHGSTRHTGKVPQRTGGRTRLKKEIDLLKDRLKEAVSREDFEQAAQLRDQIHGLEKNLQEGGEVDAGQKSSE